MIREHVGVEAPFKMIKIDDLLLAYSDEGTGPPIVCLHATAQGGRDFEFFRNHIRSLRTYRLIILDWPGHGRSDPDTSEFSAIRCEYLLSRFLVALDIQKPILVGNSIGAATAIRYAYANPSNVSGLVACNPGGLAPINRIARIFCSIMVMVARLGEQGRPLFRVLYSGLCRSLLRGKPSEAQRQRIVAAGYECASVMKQAWNSFMQPDGDIRWMMPSILCPVLFAWAKDDVIVALGPSKNAVLSTPKHELKLFDGGHCAFLESPDAFIESFTLFAQHVDDGSWE